VHWAVIAVQPIAAQQGTDHRVPDLLRLVDFEMNILKNKNSKKVSLFIEGFPAFLLHPIQVHKNIFHSLPLAELRQSPRLAASKIQQRRGFQGINILRSFILALKLIRMPISQAPKARLFGHRKTPPP
jgi:hypothetical protein